MTRRAKKPGELPWLTYDKDRHGNPRVYVRRYGRRVRMKTNPSDPAAFTAEYNTALASLKVKEAPVDTAPVVNRGIKEGTLAWLGRLYFESDVFLNLAPGSQRDRRRLLEDVFAIKMPDASAGTMGQCPLPAFDASHIRYMRDVRKGRPPAGTNNRRKALSAMCAWAVDDGKMTINPCRDVKRVKYRKKPYHTWTQDELRQFITKWPLGTKEFLSCCLLLFTGMRKSDMVRLGPDMVSNGVIVFTPQKTSTTTGKVLRIPMLTHLKVAIEATPRRAGMSTYLSTEYGKPFTAAGFGVWFRERCNMAGLPHCSAHGLRKAGATLIAEGGGSGPQLMAIFGWSDLKQANTYIEKANQQKLAAQAMHMIGIPGIVDGAPLLPHLKGET